MKNIATKKYKLQNMVGYDNIALSTDRSKLLYLDMNQTYIIYYKYTSFQTINLNTWNLK